MDEGPRRESSQTSKVPWWLSPKCVTCVVYRASGVAMQPLIGEIPAGNILLSAAILFSGSLPTKALRMLKSIRVQVPSRQTFFVHQKKWLHHAVEAVWRRHQEAAFTRAPEFSSHRSSQKYCFGFLKF